MEKRGGVLAYFGMETSEKAVETVLWVLPYLGLLVVGLVGLSWIVHKFNPMPLWIYILAMVLAIAYLFLFLARIRQMGEEAQEEANRGPGEQG